MFFKFFSKIIFLPSLVKQVVLGENFQQTTQQAQDTS
jgi:hypothetical protein